MDTRPRRHLAMVRGPSLVRCNDQGARGSFLNDDITKVVDVESRGFLLAVRWPRSWRRASCRSASGRDLPRLMVLEDDRSGLSGTIDRAATPAWVLSDADRVLIVDDWVETGSQMLTAIDLIEETGSSVVGVAVIVADSPSDAVRRLPRFHSIVPADKLGSAF